MQCEFVKPLNVDLLTETSPWGVDVKLVANTGSTNDDMLCLGEDGAPAGTIIFAEAQHAGRGRFRRPWSSSPGLGLWFSLLLRQEITDFTIPSLSAFASVALVETLREFGFADCQVKFPNDVMIGGLKTAGILVETRLGKSPFAVVGVGLNVNHRRDDFPEELRETATSLLLASSSIQDRQAIAMKLLVSLGKTERVMANNREALLATWNSLLMPAFPPGH